MKTLLTILALILGVTFGYSQKYSTKNGTVHFEATVPLFDDVDANNTTSAAVLNADTGDFACVAIVKNFRFKVALMEEHFNENYAESTKYPKTTFTGKILNFDKAKVTTTPQNYTISGTLNFHGVNNKVNSTVSIYTKDNRIYLKGEIIAKPADYKVTIPKMVTKKIAENVNVDYNFILAKS